MGALKLTKDLPEILVMNGDIITNINYRNLFKFHKKKKSDLTICTKTMSSRVEYGIVKNDKNKYLSDFNEKPKFTYNINLGITSLIKN